MIDKLIFQELTDAEAANLTGGMASIISFTTDLEGETTGILTLDGGITTLPFEVEGPEGPDLEDTVPAPAPTVPVV